MIAYHVKISPGLLIRYNYTPRIGMVTQVYKLHGVDVYDVLFDDGQLAAIGAASIRLAYDVV